MIETEKPGDYCLDTFYLKARFTTRLNSLLLKFLLSAFARKLVHAGGAKLRRKAQRVELDDWLSF
jgi:hypothetical protein